MSGALARRFGALRRRSMTDRRHQQLEARPIERSSRGASDYFPQHFGSRRKRSLPPHAIADAVIPTVLIDRIAISNQYRIGIERLVTIAYSQRPIKDGLVIKLQMPAQRRHVRHHVADELVDALLPCDTASMDPVA